MVLRIILKTLIMIAIFGGIAAYVASINGIDVKKTLDIALSDKRLTTIREPSRLVPDALRLPAKSTLVYKWKDDKGVWHFSVEKPQDADVEVIELTPSSRLEQSAGLSVSAEAAANTSAGAAGRPELSGDHKAD
jgi:hypothetical protein